MYQGFWGKLKKPIYALAPMADVTDVAFRRLIAEKSKTDSKGNKTDTEYVSWTEFVSADGLALAPEAGRAKLLKALLYSPLERPVVAQFFGSNPEHMESAARLALDLGFDGVDINMGCPDKSIERQGAGAGMIKTPEIARDIIRAVMRGATDGERRIPVSVKTRLGYNTDELDTWLPVLLKEEPAVVTIHARTRKEMSKVPAHWNRIKDAVDIRDSMGSKTLIIGNGDLGTLREGDEKIKETGADGVMFGRGVFGNPWFFNKDLVSDDVVALPVRGQTEGDSVRYSNTKISKDEKIQALLRHAELFDEFLGDTKSFAVMKKHVKAYISGFEGAKEIRDSLMQTSDIDEFREKIQGVPIADSEAF